MPSHLGLASGGLSRIQAMQYSILRTSIAMGTTSPEQVLSNFINIAKHAGPVIGPLVTVVVPWAMLVTAFTRYEWICSRCSDLKKYIVSLLYASISVPSQHTLHSQVQAWMADRGLGANARTLTLTSPYIGQNFSFQVALPSHGIRNQAPRPPPDFVDFAPRFDSLSYVPEVGRYNFVYEGRRMSFERRIVAPVVTEEEFHHGKQAKRRQKEGCVVIVITCFSPFSGVEPIRNFLSHVRYAALEASRGPDMTIIHRAKGYEWDSGIIRPKRNLDGIVLDGGIKEALVKDIDNYLRPETRVYYSNRGIPWRRGLLLYGPPGTGKTSFTTALAGQFGLHIYIISLSSSTINDRKLEQLFEQLPSKCILLLEDVDSAGIRREPNKTNKRRKETNFLKRIVRQQPPAQPSFNPYKRGGNGQDSDSDDDDDDEGITMSGLLNVLDGVHAVEGRITIMTSNHPDRLDPALVRPGRIDHKVLFPHTTQKYPTEQPLAVNRRRLLGSPVWTSRLIRL